MKRLILIGILALSLVVSVMPALAKVGDRTEAAWQLWHEGKAIDLGNRIF